MLLILVLQEDYIIRNNAGGRSLFALLIRNLAVGNLPADHCPLALPEVAHDGIPQGRFEDHHPVPIGFLHPVAGFVPIVGVCR